MPGLNIESKSEMGTLASKEKLVNPASYAIVNIAENIALTEGKKLLALNGSNWYEGFLPNQLIGFAALFSLLCLSHMGHASCSGESSCIEFQSNRKSSVRCIRCFFK